MRRIGIRSLAKPLLVLLGLSIISNLIFYLLLYKLEINLYRSLQWMLHSDDTSPLADLPHPTDDPHPIIHLLHKADADFDTLLGKETIDLASAAARYRSKRGRHPPPGFEKWFQYARDNNALVIEEFWDQIYHDLNPLWALDPGQMLKNIRSQEHIFKVRNGRVSHTGEQFWLPVWKDLLKSISKHLPDLEIAVNVMDEPRIMVPWEVMDGYVDTALKGRTMAHPENVISKFSGSPSEISDEVEEPLEWNTKWPIFDRVISSCPPESLTRNATLQTDFTKPPTISMDHAKPHSYEGYVSNYTLSTSICHQPDLQGLHGSFVSPVSIKTSNKLFPLFGSSKLSINSDILIPPAMYYKGNIHFAPKGPRVPWNMKSPTLFWRGIASGGRNTASNWKAFHRHRLVSMLNGTQALLLPNSSGFIDIQSLPLSPWNLTTWSSSPPVPRNQAIGNWLNFFTDVGFIDLECFPAEPRPGCSYTNHLFAPLKSVKFYEQHMHKYLVDIDGNSFSGRYLDFLRSNSVPIKASIFREWHDSRLVAWKHFVPFDNRYLDLYGVLEFFLGGGEGGEGKRGGGRDGVAKRIAREGREWAETVLRVEDMRVYTYRLLLEYARVMDVERDRLGWVEDLVDTPMASGKS